MIKRDDIMWLAGLLEGEGCFMLNEKRYPAICLGMTDEDVVVRAANMMGCRVYRNRNMYIAQINGSCAIAWMMMLYPILGKRRREKIVEVVKLWKDVVYSRAPRGTRSMATCHPDRVVHGLGMCSSCYMVWYKKEKLLRRVG